MDDTGFRQQRIGIARDFASPDQDIVPAGKFGGDPQAPEGVHDKIQIVWVIPVQITGAACNGIIEVPQVVIYGPATRYPPRQDNPFL